MPPSLHEPLLALFRNDLRLVAELAAPLLGTAKGALSVGQELLLLSLSQRAFTVEEALQQRIAAESTPDLLRLWMRRASTARTLDEVFTADALAPHG